MGEAGTSGPDGASRARVRLMRIAFVTGSVAPGRDGVGDYSRNLAAACIRAGHPCVMVALHDHDAANGAECIQRVRGVPVPVLRLAPTEPWPERVARARTWLERTAPDWVSWQFVPYAFQPRGLVAGLVGALAAAAPPARTHVMVHETWIGAHRASTLKHRVVGALQRRGVVRLLARLEPAIVHTSNAAYVAMLGAAGIQAEEMALCGNIPFAPRRHVDWLGEQLVRAGLPARSAARAGCWRFGLFGSIPRQWNPDDVLPVLVEAAAAARVTPTVASIGRVGSGESVWSRAQREYAGRVRFAMLGERSAEEVSWFLQDIDAGLATSPWALIGKSGTAAAMVDHGLPVIVSRDDVQFDFPVPAPAEPLLVRPADLARAGLPGAWPRRPARDGVDRLAQRFLAALATADARPMPTSRGDVGTRDGRG